MADQWDPNNFSARDYQAAKEKAKVSLPGQAALRKLQADLKKHPKVEEQLLFELLQVTLRALEEGVSPRGSMLDALLFERSLSEEKLPTFLNEIEKVVFASFRLLSTEDAARQKHFAFALEFTLLMALAAIRKKDRERLETVCAKLLVGLDPDGRDPRYKIIQKVLKGP